MSESARIRLIDEITAEVTDPNNLAPVYVDLVTELRMVNGVLHLSLASLTIDGDNSGMTRKAQVCARLRIAPQTLKFIQAQLSSPNEAQVPEGQTIN